MESAEGHESRARRGSHADRCRSRAAFEIFAGLSARGVWRGIVRHLHDAPVTAARKRRLAGARGTARKTKPDTALRRPAVDRAAERAQGVSVAMDFEPELTFGFIDLARPLGWIGRRRQP